MKILLTYLRPYRWLVGLTLFLAGLNTGFSLLDPIIFGKIVNLSNDFVQASKLHHTVSAKSFFTTFSWTHPGVINLLLLSVAVAMMSRIAKNFQDYFMNVVVQKFGAKVFTDGLQHAMKLPYEDFEDQRSGETLGVLQKVRTDTEKFINYFINLLFGVIIGVIFVFTYAAIYIHWSIPLVYLGGILLLTFISNILSRKIKIIQKNIVSQTTSLAGSTTESLRNIELVKSLGLVKQEIERLNNTTYKILDLELKKV
ncbi:MAG TPA: ABC transporter transmembrane domain-containing protein, partial [Puia sp.]|nr:ABC transporter transmembrane domain-containing protein [Puia sp.]